MNNDDAVNTEPEALNPHLEYLERLAAKNRERAKQAREIDAIRADMRDRRERPRTPAEIMQEIRDRDQR
jgi:hypothetical protein